MQRTHLAALLLAFAGCAPSGSPPERADAVPVASASRAERTDTLPVAPAARERLPAAPPCRFPAPLTTAGWKQTYSADSELKLLLPAAFAPDTGGAPFVHGGRRWTDGRSSVQEVYGHWDRSSFGEEPGPADCRTQIGGRPAWVREDRGADGYELVAWIVDDSEPYDVVLGARSPDPGDRAALLTAVRSARWE